MTRFEARLNFGADSEAAEAQQWADAFLAGLPEGATAEVRAIPVILDLEDITEEHAGNRVIIRGYFKHEGKPRQALSDNKEVEVLTKNLVGILEHVYLTGAHPGRRTFIIDGAAYDIPAYSMVELGEW